MVPGGRRSSIRPIGDKSDRNLPRDRRQQELYEFQVSRVQDSYLRRIFSARGRRGSNFDEPPGKGTCRTAFKASLNGLHEGRIDVTVVIGTASDGADDFHLSVSCRPPTRVGAIGQTDSRCRRDSRGGALSATDDDWLANSQASCRRAPWLSGNLSQRRILFREPSRTVCPGYFGRRRYEKCMRCGWKTMGHFGALRALLLTLPRRWLSRKVAANITISDHVAARLKLPRSRTVYYGIEESPVIEGSLIPPASDSIHIAYVGRLVCRERAGAASRSSAGPLSATRHPT